jgi:excisionase family DNA binding protein
VSAIAPTIFFGGKMLKEKLLTAVEVSQLLGISRSKAYLLMRQREIPAITIGKNVRVKIEDLEEYIQNHRSLNGGKNV